MLEYIKIAIETIDEDYKSGPKFVLWEDVRNFAKKNALLYMTANRLNEENAVALIDFTLTKTGEEGCLVSHDGLYFNRLQNKIDLAKLKNASCDKKTLTFTMENGESFNVKAGRAAAYLADVANEIVRLRDGGEPREIKKDLPPKEPDVVIVQKPKNNPFTFKL